MQKPVIQQGQDEFVNELKQKKYNVGVQLTNKRAELSLIERQQRQLTALIDSEKNLNHGAKPKKHKGKGQEQAKAVRLDIVRNEQKFKEHNSQAESMKREIQHLEMELKELTHDLAVVERVS